MKAANNNQSKERISVGIGNFGVGAAPQILETFSLGSCIGIALYDPVLRMGGLAHIMLPDSKQRHSGAKESKFADTGLSMLVKEMESRGVLKERLRAKIVGGASMFSGAVIEPEMKVGQRNIAAVKNNLKSAGIPVIGEDTGGTWGRTIEFKLEKGTVIVKSKMKKTKEL